MEGKSNNEGKIKHCSEEFCGFKCCDLGSDGAILLLPNEFETAQSEGIDVSHLRILNANYNGGKRVKCNAKDKKNCDNGYKPIMCKTFPLWYKEVGDVGEERKIVRSARCKLTDLGIGNHVSIFEEIEKQYIYNYRLSVSVDRLNFFIKNSKPSFYHDYIQKQKKDFPGEKIIKIKEGEKKGQNVWIVKKEPYVQDVIDLMRRCSSNQCLELTTYKVCECLALKSSNNIFVYDLNEKLVGFSLSRTTEYKTAYIEMTCVEQEYRGNNLQYYMREVQKRAMQSQGIVSVTTMVSPNNYASWRNLTKSGFEQVGETYIGINRRLIMQYVFRDK